MNEWINVKDELPPLSTSVLCVVKNHIDRIIVALTREQTTHDGKIEWIATFAFKPPEEFGDHFFPVVKDHMVTHWMNLPKLPMDIK